MSRITRIAQQAQVSYDLGLQQLSLLNKAIESNKEAIKAIESGMSTGNRNMMDLLKAYSDLHKAEKAIPILKAKLWQYWWQLQWVTGSLAI
jgi:outer membrane protein